VLDHWGRERAPRLITDGFVVVRRARNALEGLDPATFLPSDEALTLMHHLRKTDDYVITDAPYAGICLEDEPDLIFRYAADDPDAIAEVRRTHAERRELWGLSERSG
jgi:hypothetical protein